jgi:hypothetical protein
VAAVPQLHPSIDNAERASWAVISNRAAREVVQYAYELSLQKLGILAATPYNLDLRIKLEASDIAMRLPDWPTAMPDISDHMPWPLNLLERTLRPRTRKQAVAHLICYLDWYLDSSKRGSAYRILAKLLTLLFTPILLTVLAVVWVNRPFGVQIPAIVVFSVFSLSLAPYFPMLLRGLHSACLDPNTALIVYYYLRDSYRGPEDAGAASG